MTEIKASMQANAIQFSDAFGNLYLQTRDALLYHGVRLASSPKIFQARQQLCDANKKVHSQLQLCRDLAVADYSEQATDRLFELFDRRMGFQAERNDLGHAASALISAVKRNYRSSSGDVYQSAVVLTVVWCRAQRLLWPKIHCFGLSKDGHPMHPMARGRCRIPDHAQPVLWKAGSKETAP